MSPDSVQPEAPAEVKPPPAEPPRPAAVDPVAKAPAPTEAPPTPVEPPPASPSKPAADEPVPLGRLARSCLRRLLAVGGTLLLLLIAWEVITFFVAYTDDAYVRSDLVGVAPEVTGPIVALYVVDNQTIKKGDKLFTIDPTPFQLEVNQRQAQIEEETALVKVAQEQLSTAQASLAQATSRHTYAVQEQTRYADLAAKEYAPRSELDKWNDELRRATAAMTISQVEIAKAQTSINAHQGALDKAKADKAIADWKLSKTDVVSPTDGAITNLTTRIGDTATVNIPIIGIVDANAWRIMANYKQYYVRSFEVGGEAWVWLDSAPWHIYRGKITGIARGFSRDPGPDKLLPYVAPTTDWIRLQRRIPVTIVLEEAAPEGKLFMGADARTVIFPKGGTIR